MFTGKSYQIDTGLCIRYDFHMKLFDFLLTSGIRDHQGHEKHEKHTQNGTQKINVSVGTRRGKSPPGDEGECFAPCEILFLS